MTTQQKPTNIAFSGSIPKQYDKNLGTLFFEPYAGEMASRIKARKPEHILELAAGTGRLTKYLPLTVANDAATIVATDLNPAMLEQAKKIVPWKHIDWQIVDAVELPYEANRFDLVAAQFGVMFYSDKRKAYTETYRVLQPGGTFIFTAWDSLRHNPIAQLTDNIVTEFFPVDTPAFYKIPFSYFEEKEIRDDLQAAGFTSIEIESVKLEGYASTAIEAAHGLLEGTPLYNAIVERDENLIHTMVEKLAEEIRALFGDTNLTVPIQANIITARK